MNAAASINDWLGRTRRDEDEVTLGAAQRLAATLDRDPVLLQRGDELPESWYAILFGPVALQSALGRDGHPRTGDFLAPLAGTRRMFGGRRTRFIAPLKIGDAVSRLSTVTGTAQKSGSTGPFTLVTITHEISGPSGLAVTEEQDIIYRAAVESGVAAPQRSAAPPPYPPLQAGDGRDGAEGEWSAAIELDSVMVFRYSALTFNAHRIHYDLPYAQAAGLGGVIAHGMLTMGFMAQALTDWMGPAAFVQQIDARFSRPVRPGDVVTISVEIAAREGDAWRCILRATVGEHPVASGHAVVRERTAG